MITTDIVNRDLENRDRTVRMIGKYVSSIAKAEFHCLICSKTWETSPNNVRNKGRGCPYCGGTKKLTTEEVNKRIQSNSIELVEEYKNSYTNHVFVCLICTHHWSTSPSHVMAGSCCPKCSGYSWPQGGFIYLITSKDTTKIGITKNINKRLLEIRRDSGLVDISLYNYYSLPDPSRESTEQVEKALHKRFANVRASVGHFNGSSEFFVIDPAHVEQILVNEFGANIC